MSNNTCVYSSYLHCEWKSAEELEIGDKKVGQKIKRYFQKQQNALFMDEVIMFHKLINIQT